MPVRDARSPVQHHLVLHRIGTNGRELVKEFTGEIEASQALQVVTRAKRRRGYRDL